MTSYLLSSLETALSCEIVQILSLESSKKALHYRVYIYIMQTNVASNDTNDIVGFLFVPFKLY